MFSLFVYVQDFGKEETRKGHVAIRSGSLITDRFTETLRNDIQIYFHVKNNSSLNMQFLFQILQKNSIQISSSDNFSHMNNFFIEKTKNIDAHIFKPHYFQIIVQA